MAIRESVQTNLNLKLYQKKKKLDIQICLIWAKRKKNSLHINES